MRIRQTHTHRNIAVAVAADEHNRRSGCMFTDINVAERASGVLFALRFHRNDLNMYVYAYVLLLYSTACAAVWWWRIQFSV